MHHNSAQRSCISCAGVAVIPRLPGKPCPPPPPSSSLLFRPPPSLPPLPSMHQQHKFCGAHISFPTTLPQTDCKNQGGRPRRLRRASAMSKAPRTKVSAPHARSAPAGLSGSASMAGAPPWKHNILLPATLPQTDCKKSAPAPCFRQELRITISHQGDHEPPLVHGDETGFVPVSVILNSARTLNKEGDAGSLFGQLPACYKS